MTRPFHRPDTIEVLEVLAFIPVTSRKGWRVARVKQSNIEFVELRACNLDPKWEPSARDHRSTIRAPALGRLIAALQAAEAKHRGAGQ